MVATPRFEQEPDYYEYDIAFLTGYLSTTYRGTRCEIIPTKHNDTHKIPTTRYTHIGSNIIPFEIKNLTPIAAEDLI